MRASINAIVFLSIATSACFDNRTYSDDDVDSGSFSVPETGVADAIQLDAGNTGGTYAPPDVRIFRDVPTPPYSVCGNNIRESDEVCDGTDLGGATCDTFWAGAKGTLSCTRDCTNYITDLCYEEPFVPPTRLDSGRDTSQPDHDDAGMDDEHRVPVTQRCARSSGARCDSDADCSEGGCGGELCYNPAYGEIMTTCDCTAPINLKCGCVNGVCVWWSTGGIL
ncbi:MAG: hypothetical protein JXA30_07840 [Deltaproteobacteria bacterium]|nr:hypothetical protein [Deltaproteobacteria bacterium]